MLRTGGSMAKQHVRCHRVSGHMGDIAKSTRLTRSGPAAWRDPIDAYPTATEVKPRKNACWPSLFCSSLSAGHEAKHGSEQVIHAQHGATRRVVMPSKDDVARYRSPFFVHERLITLRPYAIVHDPAVGSVTRRATAIIAHQRLEPMAEGRIGVQRQRTQHEECGRYQQSFCCFIPVSRCEIDPYGLLPGCGPGYLRSFRPDSCSN